MVGAVELGFAGGGRVRCLGSPWGSGRVTASWLDPGGRVLAKRVHSLGPRARWCAVDDDDTGLIVVRAGSVARVDLRSPGDEGAVCALEGVERPVCAGAGLAVCEWRRRVEGAVVERALVVIEVEGGRERARVALSRWLLLAALSPDGAHLAVAYADGGVEVFAIGEGGASVRA